MAFRSVCSYLSSSLKVSSKSRATLALLRSESDPERILEICRAGSLTPQSPIDRISYSVAITALARSHHFRGIRSLLENSIPRILALSQHHLKEHNLSHFILLYAQAGLLQDSVNTFHKFEELGVTRTTLAFNSLLSASLLANDYQEMKRIFMDFPNKYGLIPDLEAYNILIKGLTHSGQTNCVYSLLAQMERIGVQPDGETFLFIIAGFYVENKFEDVDKGFRMMGKRGVDPPGIHIFNQTIQSMCDLNKTNEASMLLDRILSGGINLKPTTVTYGHLVEGYCREGNLEAAMWTFHEMKRRSFIPRRDCYDTLVCCLCEFKDFEGALKVAKDCMRKKQIPQFSVMKSLVEGLVNISEVNVAHKLIRQIKRKFPEERLNWSEIEEGLPHY